MTIYGDCFGDPRVNLVVLVNGWPPPVGGLGSRGSQTRIEAKTAHEIAFQSNVRLFGDSQIDALWGAKTKANERCTVGE